MIINPKVIKKGITEEQLEQWAEVNTQLEQNVGTYATTPSTKTLFEKLADNSLTEIHSYDLEDLTSLRPGAFANATNLTSVELPDSITLLGVENPPTSEGSTNSLGVFAYCTSLENIMLSSNITRIPSNTFFKCESLTSLVIPEGVEILGGNLTSGSTSTFGIAGLSGIKTLYLPNSITTINARCFAYMQQLTTVVNFPAVQEIPKDCFDHCLSLETFIIPEGVTNISTGAFKSCTNLSVITIPDTVLEISAYAFDQSDNVKNIVDNISYLVNTVSNEIQQYYALLYVNNNITDTITINSECKIIAASVFQSDSNLVSIVIPASVISIGESAFFNCQNLSTIIFESNNSLINLGERAFYSCGSLTSIDLPTTITTIGEYTFYYCSNLTVIEIPSGVTIIARYAFYNCTSLSEITVLAETPPTIQSTTFMGVPRTAIYYVPDASVDAYKTATNWSALANQIQPLSAKGGNN